MDSEPLDAHVRLVTSTSRLVLRCAWCTVRAVYVARGVYGTLRLKTSVGRWDPRTGTGTVEAVKGQYTDAEGKCRVEALLFEEFGAMSAGVEELLMRVAKVAGRKLTWWQYDQTSWSAREWMPFALQRLSVQLWTALADEAQRAKGRPKTAWPTKPRCGGRRRGMPSQPIAANQTPCGRC